MGVAITEQQVKIYTVTELTEQIKGLIEGKFENVWVEGEISNFRSPISGHYYMSLKDEYSQIKAVMFRGQNRNLAFVPRDGLKVIARGRIDVYPPRGEYQLIIDYIEPLGIGALAGETSMQKPLRFLQNGIGANVTSKLENKRSLNFQIIHSKQELDTLLEKNRGKKVLLDFSAQWCVACKELEERTFSNFRVQDALKEYLLIRADVTDNSNEEKALSKLYGVYGPPVVLFFDKEGKIQKNKTIVGFVGPEEFLTKLE